MGSLVMSGGYSYGWAMVGGTAMGGQWWGGGGGGGGQLTVPKSAVNIQVLDSTHMKKSSPARGQIANCTISAKKVCVCVWGGGGGGGGGGGHGAWLWGAPGSYMVRGGGGGGTGYGGHLVPTPMDMGGPGFYTCL